MENATYSKVLSIFGERLKELMESRKLNAQQLGSFVGLSGETIRRYCKGLSGINLTALLTLADYFSCSIDFLVGRCEDILPFTLFSSLEFPKRLRDVLNERGYSRYSLDKLTKFKDGYISNWDIGSNPNLFSLIELAEILDCSIDYLVGRER